MRAENNSSINQYINHTFVYEDELMQKVRLKGDEVLQGMQVSPHEGKLLHLMAKMIGAKNILEIGTFVGYSTLWLTQSLPADGKITTIEARPEQAEIARQHFKDSPYAEQINLIEGKALEILPILTACYDLIFIDAAKNEYMQYVELCEPMLRNGGLMLLDNSLLFGNVYNAPHKKVSAAAIKAVTEANYYLSNSGKYIATLLPTEEGLTIAMKL
jgi:predicted O-methyltransferase YrrM